MVEDRRRRVDVVGRAHRASWPSSFMRFQEQNVLRVDRATVHRVHRRESGLRIQLDGHGHVVRRHLPGLREVTLDAAVRRAPGRRPNAEQGAVAAAGDTDVAAGEHRVQRGQHQGVGVCVGTTLHRRGGFVYPVVEETGRGGRRGRLGACAAAAGARGACAAAAVIVTATGREECGACGEGSRRGDCPSAADPPVQDPIPVVTCQFGAPSLPCGMTELVSGVSGESGGALRPIMGAPDRENRFTSLISNCQQVNSAYPTGLYLYVHVYVRLLFLDASLRIRVCC